MLLNRELLPLLEKFSKACILLLRPESVHFILREVDADGMQLSAECSKDMFFEPGQYSIDSRYRNHIAFSFDIGLLRRVLGAVCRNGVEVLHMKLAMRMVPTVGGASEARPFLSLETSAHSSVHMLQDLPITQPFAPSEVERLIRDMGVELCPWYLNLLPQIQSIQAVADKLKPLGGGAVTLALTRSGAAHLQVVAPQVHLGAEFRELDVIPPAMRTDAAATPTEGHPEDRLEAALQRGHVCQVSLHLKHFQKAMAGSSLLGAGISTLHVGIGEEGGHVHVMYTLKDRSGRSDGATPAVELQLRMPVVDD